MTLPAADAFFPVLDATWPAAEFIPVGPFLMRVGAGGGQRVSAATAEGPWTEADIEAVEAAMIAAGQSPLFMVRTGEDRLDAALADHGYRIKDPVFIFAGPSVEVAGAGAPHMTTFPIWPPLAIMLELWAAGDIGPARLAVMDRASSPKTALLARAGDHPAGVAFVAVHGNIAMLHALEVTKTQRRQGSAVNILRAAAVWAQDQGAVLFSTVTTGENLPAQGLFASLNMQIVGNYHYRTKKP